MWTFIASWQEILIFATQYVRLSEFNTDAANSFDIGVSSSFPSFSFFSSPFPFPFAAQVK